MARAIAYMEREQYGQMFQFPRRYTGLPPKHEVVGRPTQGGREYSSVRNGNINRIGWISSGVISGSYQIKKMYWRYFLWQFAGRGPSTDEWVTAYGANTKEDGVDWFQFGFPLAFLFGSLGDVLPFSARSRAGIFSIQFISHDGARYNNFCKSRQSSATGTGLFLCRAVSLHFPFGSVLQLQPWGTVNSGFIEK